MMVRLQLGDAEAQFPGRPRLLAPLEQALGVLLRDLHDAPIHSQLPRLGAELVA